MFQNKYRCTDRFLEAYLHQTQTPDMDKLHESTYPWKQWHFQVSWTTSHLHSPPSNLHSLPNPLFYYKDHKLPLLHSASARLPFPYAHPGSVLKHPSCRKMFLLSVHSATADPHGKVRTTPTLSYSPRPLMSGEAYLPSSYPEL